MNRTFPASFLDRRALTGLALAAIGWLAVPAAADAGVRFGLGGHRHHHHGHFHRHHGRFHVHGGHHHGFFGRRFHYGHRYSPGFSFSLSFGRPYYGGYFPRYYGYSFYRPFYGYRFYRPYLYDYSYYRPYSSLRYYRPLYQYRGYSPIVTCCEPLHASWYRYPGYYSYGYACAPY